MSDTIWCGSGKKQKENWLKITINPDKIKDHIQEFNGNKFVKLNINIKDEANQYGKDVSVTVDTWQPPQENNTNSESKDDYDSGLPF